MEAPHVEARLRHGVLHGAPGWVRVRVRLRVRVRVRVRVRLRLRL